jgi:hypothetical protein
MSPSPKRNTRKNAAPDAVGVLDIHAGLAAHALIMAEGGGRGGAFGYPIPRAGDCRSCVSDGPCHAGGADALRAGGAA